jgi:antitoxin component YwqK of YwqJK toxin-antitoxin module
MALTRRTFMASEWFYTRDGKTKIGPDERPSMTCQWVNGLRHGLYREYQPDGSVQVEIRYVNGARQE